MSKIYTMKELFSKKQEHKNFFKSEGIMTLGRTFINENGENEYEEIKLKVVPPYNEKYTEKFQKYNPEPEAPLKDILVRKSDGVVMSEDEQAKHYSDTANYTWMTSKNENDKKYKDKITKYNTRASAMNMIVSFQLIDVYPEPKAEILDEFINELFNEFAFSQGQMRDTSDFLQSLDRIKAKK